MDSRLLARHFEGGLGSAATLAFCQVTHHDLYPAIH